MAKDRTPEKSRPVGLTKGGNGSRAGGGARGKSGGRTRPVNTVVTQQRPWGLIAGALVVVLFAAAVITYAVVKVNEANEGKVASAEEIPGIAISEYENGQSHVPTPVDYPESPPVGGEHDGQWADCTGSVYEVDIRHENAVHSLEHGAVWVTYDPAQVSDADVATLTELVDGVSGRMMSPYTGLDSPISIQSWNHQLKVDAASDERLTQFADFLTRNSDTTPEVGASCENPNFLASPLVAGEASAPGGPTDAPTTMTPETSTP